MTMSCDPCVGASRRSAGSNVAANADGLRQVRDDKPEEFVNEMGKNTIGLRYFITSVPVEKINKISCVRPRMYSLATRNPPYEERFLHRAKDLGSYFITRPDYTYDNLKRAG
jgi:hypothetical protein